MKRLMRKKIFGVRLWVILLVAVALFFPPITEKVDEMTNGMATKVRETLFGWMNKKQTTETTTQS